MRLRQDRRGCFDLGFLIKRIDDFAHEIHESGGQILDEFSETDHRSRHRVGKQKFERGRLLKASLLRLTQPKHLLQAAHDLSLPRSSTLKASLLW